MNRNRTNIKTRIHGPDSPSRWCLLPDEDNPEVSLLNGASHVQVPQTSAMSANFNDGNISAKRFKSDSQERPGSDICAGNNKDLTHKDHQVHMDLYANPTPSSSKASTDNNDSKEDFFDIAKKYIQQGGHWIQQDGLWLKQESSPSDMVLNSKQDYLPLLEQLTLIFPQLSHPRLEEFARHNHKFLTEAELAVKMEELFQEQEELERIQLVQRQREEEQKTLRTHTYYPSRSFNLSDPIENKARLAEGVFLRMLSTSSALSTIAALRDTKRFIQSIVVIENEHLEEVFNLKKKHLKNAGRSGEELLLFHGTDVGNVNTIIQNNFDPNLSKRQLYGPGIYFSEHPSISLGYGSGLILCRVLPGLTQTPTSPTTLFDPTKYDSYCINHTNNMIYDDGSREIHVIKDPCQILPYCIIHLNRNMVAVTTSQMLTSAASRNIQQQQIVPAATIAISGTGANIKVVIPRFINSPQTSTPTMTSFVIPVSASAGGGGSSAPVGQQMTPDTAKLKCKNFLITLMKLANDQPQNVATNVRDLIQDLIDGKMEADVFTKKLEQELNSSPQPCLVPFLNKSLPYLQQSLRSGELTIEGIKVISSTSTSQPIPLGAVVRI